MALKTMESMPLQSAITDGDKGIVGTVKLRKSRILNQVFFVLGCCPKHWATVSGILSTERMSWLCHHYPSLLLLLGLMQSHQQLCSHALLRAVWAPRHKASPPYFSRQLKTQPMRNLVGEHCWCCEGARLSGITQTAGASDGTLGVPENTGFALLKHFRLQAAPLATITYHVIKQVSLLNTWKVLQHPS